MIKPEASKITVSSPFDSELIEAGDMISMPVNIPLWKIILCFIFRVTPKRFQVYEITEVNGCTMEIKES